MLSFLSRVSFRGLLLVALGLIGVAVIAIAATVVTLRDDAIAAQPASARTAASGTNMRRIMCALPRAARGPLRR